MHATTSHLMLSVLSMLATLWHCLAHGACFQHWQRFRLQRGWACIHRRGWVGPPWESHAVPPLALTQRMRPNNGASTDNSMDGRAQPGRHTLSAHSGQIGAGRLRRVVGCSRANARGCCPRQLKGGLAKTGHRQGCRSPQIGGSTAPHGPAGNQGAKSTALACAHREDQELL